jgi:hypothetical protein
MRVLIVGNPSPWHVGAMLSNAASAMGLSASIVDNRRQSSNMRIWRAACWRLWGHRPSRLHSFSREVAIACGRLEPNFLLVTGQTAVTRNDLEGIKALGVKTANWVTDDPWNPAHLAGWFLAALPAYDKIFTPRAANIGDFEGIGCKNIDYLPFAYAPEAHFPEEPETRDEQARFCCDVAFIGGGDDDRFAWMLALARAGVHLKLYGGYWDRDQELRQCYGGFVRNSDYRKAVAGAKVHVALGRRANRDGHAMRSYELPAMGACIVAEDTEDHRRLYGDDGAIFVSGPGQLVGAVSKLLADEVLRERIAKNAMRRVTGAKNTYRDRLDVMLAHVC